MNIQHQKAEHYRRQPWKNGGGFTTELAVEALSPDRGQTLFPGDDQLPPPMEKESVPGLGFLWRLSIAHIERSGPFSDFAGYERTIMLLSGDGMELHFDAAPAVRIDRREEPFAFDGGWKTDCSLLGGPVKDMNLMVDRERARGEMRVLALRPDARPITTSDRTVLYVLRGEAAVALFDAEIVLKRGELLRTADAAGLPLPARAMQPDTALVEIAIDFK